MPKKESAKDKAANKSASEAEARAKAEEDAAWADDDKGKAKKDNHRKKLEEEELAAMPKVSKAPAKKVTQFEIQQAVAASTPKPKKKDTGDAPVERNINHLLREAEEEAQAAGVERHVASGVSAATELLQNLTTGGGGDSPEAHPEKRRKAAFKAYEDREIPRVRAENPSLKLSQIKEIIFKNWQKSPENPMNEEA